MAVSVLTDTQLPVLLLNNSVLLPEARREVEALSSGFAAENNPALMEGKQKGGHLHVHPYSQCP